MKFLGRWLILALVGFIAALILGNLFFDLTWFNSRDEIPNSAFWVGVVFGFVGAIKGSDN